MSLDNLLTKLRNYAIFSKTNRDVNGFILGNHQLLPIFDAVGNGLRRFLLAYGTGAGKTIVPIEIIKHLKRKNSLFKTLVIAPHQAMLENWNEEVLQKYEALMNIHRIEAQHDITIPKDANLVVVNYDKLPVSRAYHKALLEYARKVDLLIVDECHNIKNRAGKISRGLQEVAELTKNARMIALSATPCPNVISDMGMILYLIDPERYGHYRNIPFDIEKDHEAIWEMRESGRIRFFDKAQVAKFFGLPDFIEHEPLSVEMDSKYVKKYFEVYKRFFELGEAVASLERVAIEAIINNDKTKDYLKGKLDAGYALNFFSHLRNPPKNGREDQAIFSQLEKMLREIGAKRIASIHGDVSDFERLQIQEAMRLGNVDALINQWDCTDEGFSEIAGYRPILIVPLVSPFAPGKREQLIGRAYRPGQNAIVEYTEFHANSNILRDLINSFIRNYAARNNRRVKSSWTPTLFHEDAYNICRGKEVKTRLALTQRNPIIETDPRDEVNSLGSYAKLLSKERVLDLSFNKSTFGSGSLKSLGYVGVPYNQGLLRNPEPMGSDYNRGDILLYAPGKLNLFLASVVEELKERKGKAEQSWKIADLGCCSSAVFSQARFLWQALQIIEGKKVGLDEIVNVDGQDGFVNSARSYILGKEWLDTILELEMQGYTKDDLRRVHALLKKTNYDGKVHFQQANFVSDNFGNRYDVIITSQSLQYNDQTNNRDIERIVMNINRALKLRGHYLAILTGNSFSKSFTKPIDFENFLKILNAYGFEVVNHAHIQGKSNNQVVLKPFHFVYSAKVKAHEDGLVSFGPSEVPIMYLPKIDVLTGGYRIERLTKGVQKSGTNTTVPDGFYLINGGPFKLF